MKIQLKKFGTTLISRQLGREAFLAFSPSLSEIKEGEKVEMDFEGVVTFAPSWGDEFITPIYRRFSQRLILLNLKNPSVKMTLDLLETSNQIVFNRG